MTKDETRALLGRKELNISIIAKDQEDSQHNFSRFLTVDRCFLSFNLSVTVNEGSMPTRRRRLTTWLMVLLCLGSPGGFAACAQSFHAQGGAMPPHNTAAHFVAQELAKGSKPNRLVHEQSPYLLQHAFNPVDWYPWGEEAFARARAEDKPIFLSIGYSTCHWCHVMARESFADPEIAALLNQYFICIKVDREERPDVDQLYMAATQALSGGGGWPMSVFLTPELKPFYAGTYFPPDPRHGLPSFRQVLNSLHNIWVNNRAKVTDAAATLTEHLQETSVASAAVGIEAGVLERAVGLLEREFDRQHGGFGPAPKFPRPVTPNFLLQYHQRTGNEQALAMVLFTLRSMAAGGMYDHVGGGFHRYSVDKEWRVPHFEKMLYDQGQLVQNFWVAYQITGEPFYASVARDVLDYVLREMTSPEGGFFSAEDADSPDPADPAQHGEGLFYLWTEAEIMQLLGPEEGPVFAFHYGVQTNGNALQDPHGEFSGRNILYVAHTLEETAVRFDQTPDEVNALLDHGRATLFNARGKRPRPHLDDKIITAWNGHMLSALARGYQVTGEEKYHAAAVRAGRFILDHLQDRQDHTLLRRYRDGQAGLAGQLDDYAFFIQALLDLYEADLDVIWLEEAVQLMAKQITLFHDERGGGFFDTSGTDKSILVRMKSDYDGAEPTGNSITALNLLRLAQITDNEQWREMAITTMAAFGGRIAEYPAILPQMLVAYGFSRQKPRQLVIRGALSEQGTKGLLQVARRHYLPDTIVLLADGGRGQEWLAGYLPFVAEMNKLDNKPTAYLCQNYACSQPTNDPAVLEKMLTGPAIVDDEGRR